MELNVQLMFLARQFLQKGFSPKLEKLSADSAVDMLVFLSKNQFSA